MENLAWVLSELGELEEARQLQEQVLETRWQTVGPRSVNTLNSMEDLMLTLARQAGSTEPPKFSEQLKESLRRGDDISWNIFALATAHWQLGDKEEARRWYDKAVAWMDKHKPNDKDLVRFRDEAAKLIGSEGEEQERERPRGLIRGSGWRKEGAQVPAIPKGLGKRQCDCGWAWADEQLTADTLRNREEGEHNHRGTKTETPNR